MKRQAIYGSDLSKAAAAVRLLNAAEKAANEQQAAFTGALRLDSTDGYTICHVFWDEDGGEFAANFREYGRDITPGVAA